MKKIFSLIAAGAVGGLLSFGLNSMLQEEETSQPVNEPIYSRTVNQGHLAASEPISFREAAASSMPAVVHIAAWEVEAEEEDTADPYNNPFRFFFGDEFPDSPFGNPFGPKEGTGSGVIYTEDGYIVTNNHVVEFADELEVTLYNNKKYKARVIGTYPKSDLAVIKIDAADLPTLAIADSDAAQVGDWVLAVGNPMNLTSTVTAGIISAKGRDINIIDGRDAIESFIQTDAAVNPGNSGGALVNENGRLLGINTAISSNTGFYQGYSFAIPVNVVTKIADDIIETGSYQRAFLGIGITELDNDFAREMGLSFSQGVVIMSLEEGGSAQYAGLLPQDVIVAVNGRAIRSVPELQEVIGQSKVGDVINVKVTRDGEEKEIPVQLKAG